MGFVTLDNFGLLPGICVEVDATTNPTSGTRTWTDITSLVRQLSFQRSGRNQELNRSTAGSLSAICSDGGGAVTGLGLRKRQWMRVRAMPPGNGVLLLQGPSLLWRLGDAAGAAAAADASGNGRPGTYGAGTTRGQAGAIAGDPVTSTLFADSATALVTSSYSPFTAGSSRTFMGWAYRNATTNADGLFSSAAGSVLLACASGGTNVSFTTRAATTVTWTAAWPGTGQWVHWAITYNDATKVAELFINGVSKGTKTASLGYSGATTFQASSSASPWNGLLEDVAVFESVLTSAQIAAIYSANTFGISRWQGVLETLPRKWPGQGADQLVGLHAADAFKVLGLYDLAGQTFASQRNDQRVSAILALAALTAGAIDTDTDTADAVTTPFSEGSMALDYLLQIEDSENGLLIANPDATVDFQGRHWRYRNAATALATFGESAGQIPYLDDVEYDDDDSLVANIARVTPYGASTAVVVTNTASTAKYWPTSIDRQLLSSSVPLAQSAAEWLSNRYGDPAPRIPAINVELAAVARASVSLVATLLNADNSNRFTWTRQASTPISADVYLEQIGDLIDVKGGSWELQFQVSPANDEPGWVLGTSQLGLSTALAY